MKFVKVTKELDIDGSDVPIGYYEIIEEREWGNIDVDGEDYGKNVALVNIIDKYSKKTILWWIPTDHQYAKIVELDNIGNVVKEKQLEFEFCT